MQTTLRIDKSIYREAKAAAAREGISLTRFIEFALQSRIGLASPARRQLPVFDSGIRAEHDVSALVSDADAQLAADELKSLLDRT